MSISTTNSARKIQTCKQCSSRSNMLNNIFRIRLLANCRTVLVNMLRNENNTVEKYIHECTVMEKHSEMSKLYIHFPKFRKGCGLSQRESGWNIWQQCNYHRCQSKYSCEFFLLSDVHTRLLTWRRAAHNKFFYSHPDEADNDEHLTVRKKSFIYILYYKVSYVVWMFYTHTNWSYRKVYTRW